MEAVSLLGRQSAVLPQPPAVRRAEWVQLLEGHPNPQRGAICRPAAAWVTSHLITVTAQHCGICALHEAEGCSGAASLPSQ